MYLCIHGDMHIGGQWHMPLQADIELVVKASFIWFRQGWENSSAHYFFFLAPQNQPITRVYAYMYSTCIYEGYQQATGG